MSARTVVITGGGGGIGAALAEQYAALGCNLALLDIDEAGAGRVAELCREVGVEALALHCDVTSASSCEAAIAQTRQAFGQIDVVVANAGLTHLSLFEDTELAVVRRVMEVNFFGAVNIAKASLPNVLESKGQYVVMSSVAGFCPLPMRTGYAASKYAVRGFFETLRTENRHRGLAVLIVCPSYVSSEIGNHALGGDGGRATHQRPEAKQAISAQAAASQIVRAAEKRRDFLPVAKGARLAYLLSRIAPSWLERLSTRRVISTGRN